MAGIDDALAVLARQTAEAENQLVAERERIEREKASEEIVAAVTAIEAQIEPMLSGMRELGNALTAIDHLSFEVGQLGRYLSSVSGETEVALAFVVPELHRLADAVKDGNAAIPRRTKAAEPVPMPEPVVPTQTVFMLRSAKYRDENGRTRFAGQYEDATMPVPTAHRALRHGVAVSVADPRRARSVARAAATTAPTRLMLPILTPSRSPRARRILVPSMTRFWQPPISSRLIAVLTVS